MSQLDLGKSDLEATERLSVPLFSYFQLLIQPYLLSRKTPEFGSPVSSDLGGKTNGRIYPPNSSGISPVSGVD